MLRIKMLLLTGLVVALAVPSLWAQKKEDGALMRMSIQHIKQTLQARATATGAAAVCVAVISGNTPPSNYLAGTNKCSSGNALYGSGNSINAFVTTCADKGGVEGTWGPNGRTVEPPAAVPFSGSPFTFWGNLFAAGSVELANPDVYGDLINIQSETDLTLKRKEGVFGLEFSNSDPTVQTYDVTVHATDGDHLLPNVSVGGSNSELDPGAQRPIAVCNTPAITGITLTCTSCSELSGDGETGVAQIRGDKFLGF
jgi:hypothetical protein